MTTNKMQTMDKAKQERLEAKSWKVGTTAEFLELTPEEAALVENKLAQFKAVQRKASKETVVSS